MITVAIPTFQGQETLAATLESVLDQVGVDFDLDLRDDGSTDRTLEVARSIAGDRIRIARNSDRLGLAMNWNRCVIESRAPFVAVVHQDDVLADPEHLRLHLERFAAEPDLGMTISGADPIDEAGRALGGSIERGWLGDQDRTHPPGAFARELAVGNPVRCSAVVLRKEAFEAVGGFDPNWRYVVDWDFWLRLSDRWPVGWIARPTVQFRWHAGSETRRFQCGIDDLEEQERLLSSLWTVRGEEFGRAGLHERAWRQRLARAYLNRVHVALRAGDGPLARRCWGRARALWPGIGWRLARYPALAFRLERARWA